MLDAIKSRKEKLDSLRPLPPEAVRNLEAWYDLELTYTSNAIEGNTLTRKETSLVIEKGITVRGKPFKDYQEAIDHHDALRFVRELVEHDQPITERDIRDIHRLVTFSTLKLEAGAYSKYEREIFGSKVVFPGPMKIPGLMEDLGKWLGQATPSPETAFEAHLRLVSIHPFSDGNGRTSRLLMNLILMKDGYPPLVILPEDREEYFATLEKHSLQSSSADFYAFLAERLNTSLDKYLSFLQPGIDPEKKPEGPSGPSNE